MRAGVLPEEVMNLLLTWELSLLLSTRWYDDLVGQIFEGKLAHYYWK